MDEQKPEVRRLDEQKVVVPGLDKQQLVERKAQKHEASSFFDRLIDQLFNKWWGKVLGSVLFAWFAYSAYERFTRLESGELNEVRDAKWVIALYELFGKWPPVVMLAVLGALLLVWGLNQLRTGKE